VDRFLGIPIRKPPRCRTNLLPLCREYAGPVPWYLLPDSGVTLLPAPLIRMDGSYVCVPLTVMFPLGPNLVALYLGAVSDVSPNETRKLAPLRVIYHGVVWMPGEIERDTCVAQICAGTTAVKRSSSWIKGARVNCTDQEPSQKELTSFISNQIPEN
jgi:hypothetical protein